MRDEKFAEGNKQKLYSFCLLVILRASDEYPSPNFFFMVVNYHKNCLLSQEPAHSQKCYSCVDQGSSQEFIVKEIISLSKTQTNHQTLQVWWPPVISKNYNHISVSSDSNPHSDPSLAVSLRLIGQKTSFTEKDIFREYRVEPKGSIWRGVAPPPHIAAYASAGSRCTCSLEAVLKNRSRLFRPGTHFFAWQSRSTRTCPARQEAERDCSFCLQS